MALVRRTSKRQRPRSVNVAISFGALSLASAVEQVVRPPGRDAGLQCAPMDTVGPRSQSEEVTLKLRILSAPCLNVGSIFAVLVSYGVNMPRKSSAQTFARMQRIMNAVALAQVRTTA